MGEVVPRECVTNTLPTDGCLGTCSSLEFRHMWEVLWESLVAEHTVEVSTPVVEPVGEKEEEEGGEDMEEDRSKGSSTTGDLAPQQAPAPQWAMPVGPRFWFLGQGIQVARWGPPTSSKVRAKAPTMEPPPPEMDEELA